jgi:hypothetical protein
VNVPGVAVYDGGLATADPRTKGIEEWQIHGVHPNEIAVPESHLQVAEERLRRYRENPSSAQPAFEVIDRL